MVIYSLVTCHDDGISRDKASRQDDCKHDELDKVVGIDWNTRALHFLSSLSLSSQDRTAVCWRGLKVVSSRAEKLNRAALHFKHRVIVKHARLKVVDYFSIHKT